jgi:hypothetical protein
MDKQSQLRNLRIHLNYVSTDQEGKPPDKDLEYHRI